MNFDKSDLSLRY